MIPKSGYRFSEKIMLKQQAKAKGRFNLEPFRFGGRPAELEPRAESASAEFALRFQRAAAPGAKPFHETAANECRIARRLTLPRFVVDLDRQQNRASVVKAAVEQLVEMRLVAHPRAVGDAGASRHRHDVGFTGGRGALLTGDLIDAVIPNDDGEIARLDVRDRCEAAKSHQNRTVAFKRDDA